MNENFNLKVEELKENIINIINNSGLPISVIYYVYKNILKDIEMEYFRVLQEQQQHQKKGQKQEKEEQEK